jgi:hypothetical protein
MSLVATKVEKLPFGQCRAPFAPSRLCVKQKADLTQRREDAKEGLQHGSLDLR